MNLRIGLFLLLVITSFSACTKRDSSEFTDTPIVESYLRPGDYLTLNVSRQIPFSSDVRYSSDDIDNLNVNITIHDSVHSLTPLGNGEYIDNSLIVKEGESYYLSFKYNQRNVSAAAYIPSKPTNFTQSVKAIYVDRMTATSGPPSGGMGAMPVPVTLTWDNDDASYYIVIIENMETTLDPIRDFGDETPPGNMFKKSPTTSAGIELRAQEFQYFGRHRIILYHVLPDYASLYSENSTSSQNLTNPSTSIINGYGIFTGLNADTLYLNVREN